MTDRPASYAWATSYVGPVCGNSLRAYASGAQPAHNTCVVPRDRARPSLAACPSPATASSPSTRSSSWRSWCSAGGRCGPRAATDRRRGRRRPAAAGAPGGGLRARGRARARAPVRTAAESRWRGRPAAPRWCTWPARSAGPGSTGCGRAIACATRSPAPAGARRAPTWTRSTSRPRSPTASASSCRGGSARRRAAGGSGARGRRPQRAATGEAARRRGGAAGGAVAGGRRAARGPQHGDARAARHARRRRSRDRGEDPRLARGARRLPLGRGPRARSPASAPSGWRPCGRGSSV